MVDHPLQLRFRLGLVSGIVEKLRIEQHPSRRVGRSAEAFLELRCRVLRLCQLVGPRRLAHRLVEHARLLRLGMLVPAPALDADDHDRDGHDRVADVLAIGRPPRLEVVELLLLFEIVNCHSQSLCNREATW